MLNEATLVLSGLGVGGLLGALAKALLDKRHLRFSKVFDFKERRYQAISILMWAAMNPSDYELAQLRRNRPEIDSVERLDRELNLEYHNAMLFASRRVLKRFEAFLGEKSPANWRAVTRAIKKDLYF